MSISVPAQAILLALHRELNLLRVHSKTNLVNCLVNICLWYRLHYIPSMTSKWTSSTMEMPQGVLYCEGMLYCVCDSVTLMDSPSDNINDMILLISHTILVCCLGISKKPWPQNPNAYTHAHTSCTGKWILCDGGFCSSCINTDETATSKGKRKYTDYEMP